MTMYTQTALNVCERGSARNLSFPPLDSLISPPLSCFLVFFQVVVASYDKVFPAIDEGAKDVDDNCKYHGHDSQRYSKVQRNLQLFPTHSIVGPLWFH